MLLSKKVHADWNKSRSFKSAVRVGLRDRDPIFFLFITDKTSAKLSSCLFIPV